MSDPGGIGGIKALLFDVFGTVVDWRTGLIEDFTAWGEREGLSLDWVALVDAWRGQYERSKDKVRSGNFGWIKLDDLHRDALVDLLKAMNAVPLSEAQLDYLTTGWHRLPGWPDTVPGLTRLKRKFIIAPLSNGNVALLTNMARFSGLPWDLILSAEIFQHYKPHPRTYLGACELLSLRPEQVMLVAAHNYDLAAARALGLKTAFIPRPDEYGPLQTKDFGPEQNWDIVAGSLMALADSLGS